MAISCVFSLKIIYFPYFYWFHKIYCRLVLLVCEIASGPRFPRVEGCRWPLLEPLVPTAHSPSTAWNTAARPEKNLQHLKETGTRVLSQLPRGSSSALISTNAKMELILLENLEGESSWALFTQMVTNGEDQGQQIWWGGIVLDKVFSGFGTNCDISMFLMYNKHNWGFVN